MWFFTLFFRLVLRNCLIFETKVNLGNPYAFAILKLFGKFLIPFNPPNPLKNEVLPLFFILVHRNCLIFGTKVNLDTIYTFTILKLFGQFLIPSNHP